MPSAYILKSDAGKYYVGSTSNLKKRLKHHTGGHTPSTRRMGHLQLVFSQEYGTLREARVVERKIKKLKRHDYIEKMVVEGKIKINPNV